MARREGLDLPVPATLVFPGAVDADEDHWQAMVLRHLDLSNWIRIEVHDELDAVGPIASEVLIRHGLLWPYNVHFHVPIFEHARGGSVVTGFGGDEVAKCSASCQAERLFTKRTRPHPRDLLVAGLAISPAAVRTMVHRHRLQSQLQDYPWLTRAGARQLVRAYGAIEGGLPMGWAAKIRRWLWRDRYFRVCQASFRVVGSHFDVDVVHPFVEREVLGALADAGGFSGFGDRAQLLHGLFGDVLPPELIERRSKAIFSTPFWTETSREFARTWSGGGIDQVLVDPAELRRQWIDGNWTVGSATLLQSAWLHDHGSPG